MVRNLNKNDNLFENKFRNKNQMIKDLEHGYKYLGYFVDDTLVSFAVLFLMPGECEIHYIITDESYQRLGYGGSMLTYILYTFHVHKFFLEVNENNESAINLYKKYGFEVIYKREKYYPDGDALVMQKVGD